jgi:ParB/RepB/Spo0J family partition protein
MNSTTSEPVVRQAVPVPVVQNTPEPLAENVRINDLHDHPRQQELFGDLSATEFAALVDDLQRYGQREAIRILASGQIIAGHQRVRAARQLGWAEIKAFVIEVRDEAEAEQLLIGENLYRRHLGPLGLARVYLALLQTLGEGREAANGDLRDEIARRLGGISGRTLDRYRQILRTPLAVQQAVEAGEITKSMAARVADLSQADQQKIAEAIAAGESARQVVSRFLENGEDNEIVEARRRYCELLRFLKRHSLAIKKSSSKVVGHGLYVEEAVSVLLDAATLFQRLASQEKRKGDALVKRIRARVSTASG